MDEVTGEEVIYTQSEVDKLIESAKKERNNDIEKLMVEVKKYIEETAVRIDGEWESEGSGSLTATNGSSNSSLI